MVRTIVRYPTAISKIIFNQTFFDDILKPPDESVPVSPVDVEGDGRHVNEY